MLINDIIEIKQAETDGRYREVDAQLQALTKGLLKGQMASGRKTSNLINLAMKMPWLKNLITKWVIDSILISLAPESGGTSLAVMAFLQTPLGSRLLDDIWQAISLIFSGQAESAKIRLDEMESDNQSEGAISMIKLWIKHQISSAGPLANELKSNILPKYLPEIKKFLKNKVQDSVMMDHDSI